MLKRIFILIFLLFLSGCNVKSKDINLLDESTTTEHSKELYWGLKDDTLYISAKKTENATIMNRSMFTSLESEYYVPWWDIGYEKIENVIIERSNNKIVFCSMAGMFSGLSKCKSIEGFENIDTSMSKNMSYLFYGCNKLASLDLRSFNTTNVKDMTGMFSSCNSLKDLDLSSFNTSNVEKMDNMFTFLRLECLDLSSFDTSNVVSMHGMFFCSVINRLIVSSFNTLNVKKMDYMFSNFETDKLDLSNFNTSNVESMYHMFDWSDIKELNISLFDTSNVKSIWGMFGSPTEYTRSIDISHFDLSNAEDIASINDLFAETLP